MLVKLWSIWIQPVLSDCTLRTLATNAFVTWPLPMPSLARSMAGRRWFQDSIGSLESASSARVCTRLRSKSFLPKSVSEPSDGYRYRRMFSNARSWSMPGCLQRSFCVLQMLCISQQHPKTAFARFIPMMQSCWALLPILGSAAWT